MRKLILVFGLLFIIQSVSFADEVINSKGETITCKIETVNDDLVEYKKDGYLTSFVRVSEQPIFNDYVDIQTDMLKKESIVRYPGKVIVKDSFGVRLRSVNGDMEIPIYKVKFIGIYNPN